MLQLLHDEKQQSLPCSMSPTLAVFWLFCAMTPMALSRAFSSEELFVHESQYFNGKVGNVGHAVPIIGVLRE